MIGSLIKYFRFSYDQVVWEVSYVNLNMLLATIPAYEAPETPEEMEKNKTEKTDSFADFEKMLNG
jgi:hypothetical protein